MEITPIELDDIPDDLKTGLEAEGSKPFGLQHVDLNQTAPTPGSKIVCPNGCGKIVSVTSKGTPRVHKCTPDLSDLPDGVNSAVIKAVRTARAGSRKKKAEPPANVKKWGVLGLAAGAELGAEQYLKAATGLKHIPDEVTALPNPTAMCGPMVDAVWPMLPAAAQKQIASLLEHDDLIEACIHWYVYARTLQSFAATYNEQNPSRPARTGAQTHVAVSASSAERASGNPTGSPFSDGFTSGRSR